jgi:hypothetical protein
MEISDANQQYNQQTTRAHQPTGLLLGLAFVLV